jgi:VanZ family protein
MDKVGHFLAYVLMAVLALIGFREQKRRVAVTLLTLIVAVLLEWGQKFIPGRVSSVADGITNFLGLGTGFLLFWLYHRFRQPDHQ